MRNRIKLMIMMYKKNLIYSRNIKIKDFKDFIILKEISEKLLFRNGIGEGESPIPKIIDTKLKMGTPKTNLGVP